MKILICEDEEILMTAIELRLQKQGFELMKAKSGKIALEKLEKEMPDLCVCDVKSADISGLELTNYIRSVMKSTIPVILIGSLEDEELLLEGAGQGADDFIIKPFKPAELIIRIKRIFQKTAASQAV